MDAILHCEIPSLNLINTSFEVNRGAGDFIECSKACVAVAFRFIALQDVENQTAGIHIMIVTS
jgi:hypothetical protein